MACQGQIILLIWPICKLQRKGSVVNTPGAYASEAPCDAPLKC